MNLLNENYLDPATLAKYHVLTQERGISLTLESNPEVEFRRSSSMGIFNSNVFKDRHGKLVYRDETPGLLLLGKDAIAFTEADSYADVAGRLSQSINDHFDAFFATEAALHGHGLTFEIISIVLPLEEFESAMIFGRIGEYGIASAHAGRAVVVAGASLYGTFPLSGAKGATRAHRVYVRAVAGHVDEAGVTSFVGGTGRRGVTISRSSTPVPLSKSAVSSSQVARNRIQGEIGEEVVRARLMNSRTFDLVGEQIRIRTPGVGSFRVTDFLVRNKRTNELLIIEVKTGGATRNASQLAKDALIADPLSPTSFFGVRARDAKSLQGSATGGIRTIEINASNLNR